MSREALYEQLHNIGEKVLASCKVGEFTEENITDTEFELGEVLFAVYTCGCTDCFMGAIFRDFGNAVEWSMKNKNPEGNLIIPIKLNAPWLSIPRVETSTVRAAEDCIRQLNDLKSIKSYASVCGLCKQNNDVCECGIH